jgi:hypothetical protein
VIDLVGDIEGDLAQLLTELDAHGDDIDSDVQRILDEIGVIDEIRTNVSKDKRTHVGMREHRKTVQDAIEAREAEMIAAIDRAVDAMTQSITQAMATPRVIVRDPETNRIEGSVTAEPVDIRPGANPEQLANASPAVRELYASMLRLGQVVAEVIGRPKQIGRDQDGRPFLIK